MKIAIAVRAILVCGFALVLLANYPGHLSIDSVIQMYEGQSGIYSSVGPPLMSWLLGLLDRLVPGGGLFVILNAALFFGSLLALTTLRPRAWWLAVPVAIAFFVLSPLTLIYQAIVWKDVLFANLALAGFVCLAHSARLWPRKTGRLYPLAGCIFALALAALTRQNGLICLILAALAVIAFPLPADPRKTGAFFGLGTLAAGLILIQLLSASLSLASGNAGARGLEFGILIVKRYDIVGAAHFDPKADLSRIGDSRTQQIVRELASRYYSPERDDFLGAVPPSLAAWSTAEAIGAQWDETVRHDTAAYLRHRWAVFDWVMFTPALARCLPIYVGIDGLPGQLKALHLTAGFRPRDHALWNYATPFMRTPVFSHLTYALGALVVLGPLALRRRQEDFAIGAMLVSALAFAASFFFIAIACDYRYLYFLDVAAMAGLFYVALDPPFDEIKRLVRHRATPLG